MYGAIMRDRSTNRTLIRKQQHGSMTKIWMGIMMKLAATEVTWGSMATEQLPCRLPRRWRCELPLVHLDQCRGGRHREASSRPSAMVPRTRSDQAPPFHRGQTRGGVCARKTIRPTTPRKPYVMVATGEWRRGTTVRSGADSGSLAESRSSTRNPDVGRAWASLIIYLSLVEVHVRHARDI
jgi:hypothetical protein